MKKYVEVCEGPAIEFRVKRYIGEASPPSDLTVCSVEDAMQQFIRGVGMQSGTLIIPESLALVAGQIRDEFAKLTDIGLGVIVLPDAMIGPDSWALMNEHHQIVWSPGA